MKTNLFTITLCVACGLVAWFGADDDAYAPRKKPTAHEFLLLDSTANAICAKKGFNFTGLRDSIKKHPHAQTNYHTKKLWGYIK